MNSRREKSRNFTEEEKILLLEIIKRYAHILEEKSSTLTVINKKKMAWDEICHHYNAVSTSGPRNVMHLKIFFKNLKQRIRKDADENTKLNLTAMLNNYDTFKNEDDRKFEPKIQSNLTQMIEEKKLDLGHIQNDVKGLEINYENYRREWSACNYLETIINESSCDIEDYKRERSRNYTEEEKRQLLEIIKKYAHVFEENSTNQKKVAWDEITEQYNSICTTGPRTVESLKIFFKNLKQKLRKDLPESHKYSYTAMFNNVDLSKICATKYNKSEERIELPHELDLRKESFEDERKDNSQISDDSSVQTNAREHLETVIKEPDTESDENSTNLIISNEYNKNEDTEEVQPQFRDKKEDVNEFDNDKHNLSFRYNQTSNETRLMNADNYLENMKGSDIESDENSTPSEQKNVRCKRKISDTSIETLKRIYLKKRIQLTNFQLMSAKKQHNLDMKIKKLKLKQLQDMEQ